MTDQNFVYWLQGFFEIQKPVEINCLQLEEIRNHLKLVFTYESEGPVSPRTHLKLAESDSSNYKFWGPERSC